MEFMVKTREWINKVVDMPISKRGTTDYHYLFSKGLTLEEREKYWIWDIWINWAICLKCKDFIRSMNGHDFKFCSCGAIAVDWGSWYCRRVWSPNDYIDIIEYFTNK